MTRTSGKLAALLAVLALFAAACGGGGDPAPGTGEGDDPTEGATTGEGDGQTEGQAGGEVRVYINEPESLTPSNTNEVGGAQVLHALFTPLVEYDAETSEPSNAMAESIESDDNQNWTITIQDGWTFHDGTPVTAASFVDAWNYAAYGPNAQGNSYFFSHIEGYDEVQGDPEADPPVEPTAETMSGLEVVDDRTFTVRTKEPFSQFPLTLGYTAFYPMPESAFEDIDAFNDAPVGNGPFQIDGQWNRGQNVRVTRYEDYAGEAPSVDAVDFRIYSEINTAYNDLLAGNIDVMDAVPPEQLAAAQQEFGDRFIDRESSSFTYLGFPLYDERFANRDLRVAFSKAIDRELITETIFDGTRVPALSVVSPVVAGARDNPCGENCEYDPEGAKELFDAAGGYEGTLTLWFNSGAGHEEWMNAVSNMLRTNLGIETIEFQSLEFAEYLGLLDNQEITGPFRLGWVMDYPSPQNYLEPLHRTGGSSNNTGYSNPDVDELIAQGNAAGSIDEGIDFYHQAEDLILEDMPIIPLFFGRVTGAHSDRVSNVHIDAFTRVRVEDITVNE
jgi:oligopeptide transport system substrate-binding protein